MPFSAPILCPTPQDRGQGTRSGQPAPGKKPLAVESYYAAVGIFGRRPLRPAPGQRPGHALWAASPLKEAICRGVLVQRGRNFWPVPFSAPIPRPTPQDTGQDTFFGHPAPGKKPLAVESYYAAVGIFGCRPFGPYNAPHAPGQRPGHALWAASPLKEATCRGILVRRGRNFWPVPFSAPIPRPTPQDTGQDTFFGHPAPGKKPLAVESYYAAVGIFGCRPFGLYNAPHATGQRPGHALWAASPLKEAVCGGILLRCGRNFWPLPFSASITHPTPQDRG